MDAPTPASRSGPPDSSYLWRDLAIGSITVGLIVALLIFAAVEILANTIAPAADEGAITWGAVLVGLAAGSAVVGVILVLRDAVVLPPPPKQAPVPTTGRSEASPNEPHRSEGSGA